MFHTNICINENYPLIQHACLIEDVYVKKSCLVSLLAGCIVNLRKCSCYRHEPQSISISGQLVMCRSD